MEPVREATISGFNEFVGEQRTLAGGGRALLSLTQFDNRYEVNFVGEPIENVPDLDRHSYAPRGTTALYDAIGRTVRELEAWVRAQAWRERVLVLIVTDGQENASQEYDFQKVRTLIEQKEKDGWNFAYMGANQDSFAVAGSLNIRRDFTANYDATASGIRDSYHLIARSTAAYRSGNASGAAASGFFGGADPDGADTGKLVPNGTGATDAGGQTDASPSSRTRH
jgi:hypothetical protein